MSEDRFGNEPGDRSWLEKIALLFSSEPHNRKDLEGVLAIAAENEVIDQDARSIMEGAMKVSDMQARDIMIPRAQMVVIKAESTLTIEDVLEEIVGDIEDETDVDEDNFIRKISDDDFFIKALTPIEDFNDYFRTDFSDEEFDTIGGLVIQAFGHMPARNEVTQIENFEFKVINADQRKIHSLRMRPLEA